jgi:carbon dioxide concentrating mechanism protein CcmM
MRLRKFFKSAIVLSVLLLVMSTSVAAIAEKPAVTNPSSKSTLTDLQNPIQVVVNSSFISPLVEMFGNVSIGQKSFIAGNTTVRADPDTRICIGNETNFQDNILFLSLRNLPAPRSNCGDRTSSSTQNRVSVAHQAIVKNSSLGNFTFVGFHARITNSVLEDGVFVLHGATVTGVRIPQDRLVPIGAVITTQAQANALAKKSEANSKFQNDVLEVNEEFAEHYGELYEQNGFDSVTGVTPAPKTSWNLTPVKPTLGKGVRLEEFARLVGDVQLGDNSVVGHRTSIRADEGAPIVVGSNAEIEDRVTFHALKGTSIRIGKNLDTDDNIVFHGPLEVGDNLTIKDDAILFKSKVGNRVTINRGAIVVGVTLKDGAQVPNRAVITTQDQADALLTRQS